jgi:hypothetical protein
MEHAETLESFFWGKLGEVLKERCVEVQPATEHYLVQMLSARATQPVDDTPLALKLLAAREEAEATERRRQLRDVGDTSLFVSGFWADSFARRVVDVDYYIGLGGTAYGELARGVGWGKDPYESVYGELADKFARFVGVLAALSHYFMPASTPQDVLKLYERYRATGSRWAQSRLAALGVLVPARGPAGGKPQ